MTLIKKPYKEDKKPSFDIVFGFAIVLIVMAIVAIFFPMLILPLLK